PTESLPPRFETAHAWMFDSRELERFGWRLGDLPAGAKLRYASHSLWHKHRNLLIPIAFVLLTAAFVVAVLFATVRRQHRAELALLAQKQRLSTALTASAAGVFEIHGSRVYASSRWLELVGADRSDAQLPEGWMRKASDESRARFLETIRRLSETVGRERLEIEIVSEPRVLDVLLTTADGEAPRGVVGVATDITHRRRMETEASSRTRLQALGELAGGIAHDFNNILTVINGTAELIRDVRDLDEIRAGLDQIEGSGARAAELVRKLLLFGRRDHRASRPIDLNTPIRNLHGFLRPLVGETHEVVTILHDEPLGVPLDAAHVEQLLSNLVINARDALPEGGPIHVSTGTAWVEGTEWAILRVSDAGIGMSEEVRARIFEPFFTTKPVGGGSGLGLSTVWGIVSGSGGEVRVDSAPGAGTTVTARWARLDLPEVITGPMTPLPVAHGRSILLVEDDPGVAYVTETLLQGAGYRVRHAADGREGLQMFESQPDDFDLVFSDLVLPHLSGVEMVDRIRKLRPTVRVGFLTGYAHHPSLARVVSPPDRELLRKPFSKRELQEYVSGRLTPR
ncbi:MAG: ATP-binding protein, partial [Myxococcota bacterium]